MPAHRLTLVIAQLSEYAEPRFWLGALALVGVFAILIFVAALLEKRQADPWRRVPDGAEVRHSPYVLSHEDQLSTAGFTKAGDVYHSGLPKVKVLGSVWMSPDRRILVLTAGGTVYGQKDARTVLRTPLSDGRYLATTDGNHHDDEVSRDVSRLKIKGKTSALLGVHRRLIERHAPLVRRWVGDDPVENLLQHERDCSERLVAMGRARWADAEQTCWRGTWRLAGRHAGALPLKILKAMPQALRDQFASRPSPVPPVPVDEQVSQWG